MSKIESFIYSKENEAMKFRPSESFYKKIGVGKRRFWQILRNEQSPTLDELKRIATYFNVSTSELAELN